ncbi:hypothetical protein BJ322DRAFT_1023695 [Thelephora terrestris]|uniref:Protein kinase domain-containing protein n=1 Tax=Thelephora terrestris TaxID=56493 RepID=A0A9P6L300_9AGAM|nr:hypothetical protein BJ322DRAFT_1023695 [Thelephora terrestris]
MAVTFAIRLFAISQEVVGSTRSKMPKTALQASFWSLEDQARDCVHCCLIWYGKTDSQPPQSSTYLQSQERLAGKSIKTFCPSYKAKIWHGLSIDWTTWSSNHISPRCAHGGCRPSSMFPIKQECPEGDARKVMEVLDLVSDQMLGGDLTKYIENHSDADLSTGWPSHQSPGVAGGLRYFHSCYMTHGDLKVSDHTMDCTGDPGRSGVTQSEKEVFSVSGVMIQIFTGPGPFSEKLPQNAISAITSGERPPRLAHQSLTEAL